MSEAFLDANRFSVLSSDEIFNEKIASEFEPKYLKAQLTFLLENRIKLNCLRINNVQ